MGASDELKERLLALVVPIFEQSALDLVELNVRRQGAEWVIQVLADRPGGGISLEECSYVNRKIVETIDAAEAVVDYSLEVSSPGIDRPLKTKKDFLRVLHQDVRFHLSGPVGGKKEYIGLLKKVDDEGVVIETQKHGEITIPINNIVKAVLVF